jgi:hypothetical protein
MRNRLTLEEFINKAEIKHSKKYNYDFVDYIRGSIKVKIKCSIHGLFEQTPQSHLSGKGCPECGNNHRVTTKEFIDRANIIHNYKYDYSQSVYFNKQTSLKIICPYHGIFDKTPMSHIFKKAGCPKCKGRVTNLYEFVEKSKIIHGDKYDYSLSVYNGNKSIIDIVCKDHGSFRQIVNYHLSGCGCPQCGGTIQLTLNEFVGRSKKIHGDRYLYDKVVYLNNQTKVEIFCKRHNLYFLQSPDSHFRGSGCPSCNESKGEKLIAKYLDNKKIKYHREYKFDDCKNINLLKFDFYLPEHNLCIEYDGRQHFESMDIFGGAIEFEKRKINDKIKNNFCMNSKIELFRIPFFQRNIESLLQEYFTKS